MRAKILICLMFLGGLGAGHLAGCSSDEAIDCRQVCGRYKDCVDKNFDTTACQNRCEQRAKENRDFDDQLEHCDKCISDRTCSEAAVSCALQCLPVL